MTVTFGYEPPSFRAPTLTLFLPDIVGINQDGTMVRTIDPDEAADAAGGSDKLLAVVSNETEVNRVAQTATSGFASVPGAALQGAAQGMSSGCASGCGLAVIAMPVAGAALGAAIALVYATVTTTYYASYPHARRMAMIQSVSIPKSSDEIGPSSQAKGFIYYPASNLASLRIALFDRRYGLPLTVKTPVVSRPPEAQPR